MRILSRINWIDSDAKILPGDPTSDPLQPTLVLDNGKVISPASAFEYGYFVIEASDQEIALLRSAGYSHMIPPDTKLRPA